MKRPLLPGVAAFGLMLALAACATGRGMDDGQKLALYRAHAGAPVPSFRYFGRMEHWEALGDSTIAVWTRPSEAWLLELGAPCPGLDFAIGIGLTSSTGRVSARFDDVLVANQIPKVPCRIQDIRPLDIGAIRAAGNARAAQPSGT